MALELRPLCTVTAATLPPIMVGEGSAGTRMVVPVGRVELTGERLRGVGEGGPAADWVLVGPGGIATIDVRFSFTTDDGATIFVAYGGRMDPTPAREDRVIHVAPRFETGDPRYAWLNAVQAVGRGHFTAAGVQYEWFEVM
ncbi:MAG TPA: DUF3237 domain-containing protein [Miltoncostaeaceae bacterium]|nr:DUF3237 domain-containing protein [Miltoncostaeaceae bacterium]